MALARFSRTVVVPNAIRPSEAGFASRTSVLAGLEAMSEKWPCGPY